MDDLQHKTEAPETSAAYLPWHRPVLQRLEISTQTGFGGTSFDDGDGLGLISQDASG